MIAYTAIGTRFAIAPPQNGERVRRVGSHDQEEDGAVIDESH